MELQDSSPGSSIGRAVDCKSNDPCRAVVQSPVRADIFFRPPVHSAVMGSWSL